MVDEFLDIAKDDDIIDCPSALDEDFKSWKEGTGGPVYKRGLLKIDYYNGAKSDWNKTVITALSKLVKNAADTKWTFLPKYPLFYYEKTIRKKLANLITIWNRNQPKLLGPGPADFETAEQVEERVKGKKIVRNRHARQTTRRRTVSRFVCARYFYRT